jgi:Dehydratase family
VQRDGELTSTGPGGRERARLRSAQWYSGDDERNNYIHRAWMRRGVPDSAFSGRPQIAIANTASDLTPCNAHLTEVAASVRNGVYEAGGIPLELPVVSLGETLVRPTAMLWRNMAAMATEEMLRANPIDGVVLLGGCDKTIPSLLMAAASVATSSSSTSSSGVSTSICLRTNGAGVRRTRPPLPGSPIRSVAGNGSTSTMCCRPTPAPTSTSSSARPVRE